jgi:hypothetical protein
MEFADEAEIAKHKQGATHAKVLYLKAFQLEKEAAMKTPLNLPDAIPRQILLRSAASLAMLSEQFEEAERLIFLGLNSMPSPFIEQELNELTAQIKKRKQELKKNAVQLTGLFTYVNAAENEIKIQESEASFLHTLIAPSNLLKEVVRNYFLENVNVHATVSGDGILLLTDMNRIA